MRREGVSAERVLLHIGRQLRGEQGVTDVATELAGVLRRRQKCASLFSIKGEGVSLNLTFSAKQQWARNCSPLQYCLCLRSIGSSTVRGNERAVRTPVACVR